MSPSGTTAFPGPTMSAKLIGVQQNESRPVQRQKTCNITGQVFTWRVGTSRPTECLFLVDGSLKWVAVNAGVFPGNWSIKYNDLSRRIFPPFPTGSWNIGQIRRCEDGEIRFTKLLEKPLEGIDEAFIWHPTKIEFTDFELIGQWGDDHRGRLWHVKHPNFKDTPVFMKIDPWWPRWAIKNETRAYQRVDGLGIAPKFLGHVTYHGAVIGFITELLEGARSTEKKDEKARIEVVKKLHALGITHGTAHRHNFLKVGKDVLVVDFEESRFDDEATDWWKNEDIKRIDGSWGNWGDMDMAQIAAAFDDMPQDPSFFDDLVDEQDFAWTDDSEAEEDEEALKMTT
ncbi:hypothetical protein F4859DRAFT_518964 [Xylaria cf. heliscus]|nr:hypothetical protein F4859DRAFT_518964 [Xylaria cf. heliscus]